MSATRRRAGDDEKPVCPECSHHYVKRRTRGPGPDQGDEDWYCEGCGAKFDDPAYREMESNDDPKTGYAAVLADPEVTSIEEALERL